MRGAVAAQRRVGTFRQWRKALGATEEVSSGAGAPADETYSILGLAENSQQKNHKSFLAGVRIMFLTAIPANLRSAIHVGGIICPADNLRGMTAERLPDS